MGGYEMDWGSFADWLTVIVAAPAAILFLWDRHASDRQRLTVRATNFSDFKKLTIQYRPASFDRGIAVGLEAIEPPDMTFADITHQEPGKDAGSKLWLRMFPLNGSDATLHCRVTVKSPSTLPSSVIVKVSLIRVPGKTPFTSRRMRISAIS